jgi:hypothetical protein
MNIIWIETVIFEREKQRAAGRAHNIVGDHFGIRPGNIANVVEYRVAALFGGYI